MNRPHFSSIDIIRGIAVCAVVISHSSFSTAGVHSQEVLAFPGDDYSALVKFGAWGVQLFVVVSGFCIHLRWASQNDVHAPTPAFGEFWKRRIFRLYPLYFVVLVASYISCLVLHGVMRGGVGPGMLGYESFRPLFLDLFSFLSLTQNFSDASHRISNAPLWSLAMEEQLYLLYFPFLWLRKRIGLSMSTVFVLAVSCVWMFFAQIEFCNTQNLGPSYWFNWVCGAVLLEGALAGKHLERKFRYSTFFGGVFLLLASTTFLSAGGWDYGLFVTRVAVPLAFALLVWFLLTHESELGDSKHWMTRFLKKVGQASYSIYLVHVLFNNLAKAVYIEFQISPWIILSGRIVGGVLLGWVVYQVLERPLVRRFREILNSSRNAAKPVSPG